MGSGETNVPPERSGRVHECLDVWAGPLGGMLFMLIRSWIHLDGNSLSLPLTRTVEHCRTRGSSEQLERRSRANTQRRCQYIFGDDRLPCNQRDADSAILNLS